MFEYIAKILMAGLTLISIAWFIGFALIELYFYLSDKFKEGKK